MKKTTLLLTATIALLLFSCSTERKKIERNAYNYAYAMANYNIDEAEPYATPETRNTTLVIARRLVQAVDSSYIISDTPAQIKILDIEIYNDTQAYALYHKTTPIKDFCDTLYLRKRDGNWYAHVLSPVPNS